MSSVMKLHKMTAEYENLFNVCHAYVSFYKGTVVIGNIKIGNQ